MLVCAVVATACGSPPREANRANTSASSSRFSAPSSTAASGARLTGCIPSASTRTLSGAVAAYYWTSPASNCVTVTLIDSGGQASTVTTTTISQYRAKFVCQDGNQGRSSPESGLTPGPAYSVSKNRIYWWDGHLIRCSVVTAPKGVKSWRPATR